MRQIVNRHRVHYFKSCNFVAKHEFIPYFQNCICRRGRMTQIYSLDRETKFKQTSSTEATDAQSKDASVTARECGSKRIERDAEWQKRPWIIRQETSSGNRGRGRSRTPRMKKTAAFESGIASDLAPTRGEISIDRVAIISSALIRAKGSDGSEGRTPRWHRIPHSSSHRFVCMTRFNSVTRLNKHQDGIL